MNPQNHRASNQAIKQSSNQAIKQSSNQAIKQRKPHAESTAHLLFSSAVSQAMAWIGVEF